jgi:hypothetical protein
LDVRDTNVLSTLDGRFPIVDTNDDWVVVMRVRNPNRRTLWFGPEKVQLKVQGRWLEPKEVAWLNSKWFCATVPGRSQEDFVVAVVPNNTEVVRLILTYLPQPLLNLAHDSSRLYSHNAQSKFQKIQAGVLLQLDRWAIEPLWRWQRSEWKEWPSRTIEFALPRHLSEQSTPLEKGHNAYQARGVNGQKTFCSEVFLFRGTDPRAELRLSFPLSSSDLGSG